MEPDRVVIAGTGRAGTGVGLALNAVGLDVTFLSTGPSRLIGPIAVIRLDDETAPRGVPWVILAVPDGHLVDAARSLADSGIASSQTLVGHLSGALSSSILDGAGSFAGTFAAHPLFSFPPAEPPRAMPAGTLVMIETMSGIYDRVAETFRRAGATTAPMDTASKPLYHAAAVLCANLPTVVLYQAARLFEECGVPGPDRAAVALLSSVLSNQTDAPGPSSITGPFMRGDLETIERNLQALDYRDPEVADIYRILGDHLADLLAQHKILSEEPWKSIKKILS